MHRNPKRLAGSLFWVLPALAAASLAAEHRPAEAVQLDPSRTHIGFTLKDTLHTVKGTFRLKSGAVRFDPASGAISGLVVVDAASGESGNHARDRRMHEKILESRAYPEITFRPERIEGTLPLEGESRVQIHGQFGIHGAEHEIVVPATLRMHGADISGDAHLVVPYVAWGLKNPSNFLLHVSEQVEIDIQMAGRVVVSSTAVETGTLQDTPALTR